MELEKTLESAPIIDKKNEYQLEEALTIAGCGWYNVKYGLIVALFLVASAVEVIGYSFVMPAAKCDLNMSDSSRGFIASLPYIAIVLTSFAWGYLVDRRGRKATVIRSSLGVGLFGILASFMPNLYTFAACKLLANLCIACPSAVPFAFIGEITPKKYRDVSLSAANSVQTLGTVLVPLLAWGLLSLDYKLDFGLYYYRSWRTLAFAYSSISIIAAILMSFGPESPKYLLSKGRDKDALKVLKTMYAINHGKSPDDFPVKKLVPSDDSKSTSFLDATLPVLKPPYIKWLALNGFLLYGIFATLNGFIMWTPDVLNRVFSGNVEDMTACEVIGLRLNKTTSVATACHDNLDPMIFKITTLANASTAVIIMLSSAILKVIGKRAVILLMFLTLAVFCVSVNFIRNATLFAIVMSMLQLTAVGLGPVNAFSVEIFPTYLRGMAVSLAMMFGRIGSVMSTNLVGLLINHSCETTFYLFGGLLFFCFLLTFLLPKPKNNAV